MAIVTGPELDNLETEVRLWYVTTRQWLIQQLLAKSHPVGNVRLSNAEQHQRYVENPQAAIALMEQRLMAIYRGDPKQLSKVQEGLQSYINKMNRLATHLQQTGLMPEDIPAGSAPAGGFPGSLQPAPPNIPPVTSRTGREVYDPTQIAGI